MSSQFRTKASFALNVVLVVVLIVQLWPKSEKPASQQGTSHSKSTRDLNADRSRTQTSDTRSGSAPASDQRRSVVDQLRAAGVSNRVLARFVQADRDEAWEKRFEQGRNSGNGDAMAALQLEHDMTLDQDMRAALGEEGFRAWDQERMLREANIGKVALSPEESGTIYNFKKSLQQRQWDLESARLKKTMDDAEINDAANKAYAEYTEQMKALLGEQRYAKSLGMDDETAANNLRQDLAKVGPNDSQFRDLLKAQRDWTDRRSEIEKQYQDSPTSPEYAAKLKALDDARDSEYQRVLGASAFDKLQKEQDGGYSKMKKYQDIWGLNDSSIDYVYGATKYFEKSVQDYQAQANALEAQGQKVDWEAVTKNLQQFTAQSQQALKEYLGQERFEKLQKNGVLQFDPTPRRGFMP
jgi:plasmid maintenance system killer protein